MRDCLRRIKAVDITRILAILPQVPFVPANACSTNPEKAPCFVVPDARVPAEAHDFVGELGLGGETARVLIRKLEPYQGMAPHVDRWMPQQTDWRRFQVPLVSHPGIVMRWPLDGVSEHLEPGWLYEVDFSRLHEVVNETAHERVHLQIDQINATI